MTINTNKNLKIVESQSKKSKMRFVSTSSEDDSPTKSLYQPSVPTAAIRPSSVPDPVQPYASSRISVVKPDIASPILRSDSSKRKKSSISSPECNFDLTDEFDLADNGIEEDKSCTNSAKSITFKHKLQRFKYGTAIQNGFDENDRLKNESINCKDNDPAESLPDLRSEAQHVDPQSEFVSGASIFGAALKRPRISSGTDHSNSSILRYSSVSNLEKDNSQERELQMMLKRRRESGKCELNNDAVSIAPGADSLTIVLETPDDMDNYDLGSDFEEEFEPSKPGALSDLSNQPVSTRKPLFNRDPFKTTNRLSNSTSKPGVENTVIYSSDDDVWPDEKFKKQVQHSLSSADEIEEPEEDVLRKVKLPLSKTKPRRKKSRGGNTSLVEIGKKGRMPLSLGSSMISGNNSEDDFM